MIDDLLGLTLRTLRRRGLRSVLTMLGIFMGIAAVVSLISLGEGLRSGVVDQFAQIGSDRITISASGSGFGPPGSTSVEKLTEDDVDAIRDTRGIKVATSRLIRTTPVEFNDIQNFEFIVSMPENTEERNLVVQSLNLEAEEGRMLRSNDGFKIMLGPEFKTKDVYGKNPRVGSKLSINGKDADVIGFFNKQSNPQFNNMIIMNQEAMEDALGFENQADLIVAQVISVNDIERTVENVEKVMRKQRDVERGKEDFTVETPEQLLESFNTIFGIIQSIVVGIAGISLLVGGVGIANTMFTSVYERRREIGIMKAVGARNNSILTLFVLESGLLGFFGGVVGIILGIFFTKVVELLGAQLFGDGVLVAQFQLPVILGALAFSTFVGILSGVIPAKQAASIPPVEALRK